MFLLRYWAPLVAYCGAIYLLSSLQPTPRLSLPFAHTDKLVHLVEYALLGCLAVRAFGSGTGGLLTRWEALVAAILFAACYGSLDEVHQSYVPGRDLDFVDLIADVGGASLAAFAISRWHVRPSKNPPMETTP